MSCFSGKTGKVSADMSRSYKSDFHVGFLILSCSKWLDADNFPQRILLRNLLWRLASDGKMARTSYL